MKHNHLTLLWKKGEVFLFCGLHPEMKTFVAESVSPETKTQNSKRARSRNWYHEISPFSVHLIPSTDDSFMSEILIQLLNIRDVHGRSPHRLAFCQGDFVGRLYSSSCIVEPCNRDFLQF